LHVLSYTRTPPLAALTCARASSMRIDGNRNECDKLVQYTLDPRANTFLYSKLMSGQAESLLGALRQSRHRGEDCFLGSALCHRLHSASPFDASSWALTEHKRASSMARVLSGWNGLSPTIWPESPFDCRMWNCLPIQGT
jgi:hypothetical protein